MGTPALIPKVQKDDWVNLNRVLRKLAFAVLGPGSVPTFGGLNLTGTLNMNNNPITNVDYIDFDLTNGVAPAEGRMVWNDDDGTVNLGLKGGHVNLQMGLEEVLRVTNNSGGDLLNGTPAYISGATGANPTIDEADADFATGVGLRTVGLLTEDIANGQKGYVTTSGYVRDIDTSMFAAEGMPAYLAKGGGFATAPPTAPDATYLLGIVIRKHATEGIVLVNLHSLPYLKDLSDMLFTDLADHDLLYWDSGANVWKNTSTPTFTSLILTDHLQIVSGGSAASPAVRIAADNTGLLASSTTIGLSLAGVNRFNYSSVGSSWAMTFPSSSLLFAHGAITSTSGQISFGDEDLVTTGKLTAHSVTLLGGHVVNVRTVNDSTYNVITADWLVWVDASANAVTVNLPASPEQGREVEVKCIDNTNTCTIGRNGNNIDGVASDLTLVLNESYVLVYDEAYGWGVR
jgi:hypothetical protein